MSATVSHRSDLMETEMTDRRRAELDRIRISAERVLPLAGPHMRLHVKGIIERLPSEPTSDLHIFAECLDKAYLRIK